MENKKVLIIIPVYNVELTIYETLSTITQQKYCNYEVIVSENYSNDGTLKILEKFEKKIKIIKPPRHLEGEKHFNYCLDYAKKRLDIKYLAIYHGDDLYSPDIVRLQVDFLNRNKEVPAVFSDSLIIDEKNKIIGWVKNKRKNQNASKYTHDELLFGMISSTVTCLTPTVMLRCNLLREKNYELEPDVFGRAADYGLWLKLALDYGYLGIIHHEGIRYRRIGNNASTAIEKLNKESDSFKTIAIYIGTDEDAQKKGWKWKAHIDRLRVQDYFRRFNSVNNNTNIDTKVKLKIPEIGIGYYIISMLSVSGIYYIVAMITANIFQSNIFSNRFKKKAMKILLDSSIRNKIRSIRYKIMEAIKIK
jgi:glycosyltransferase involved in cell wall biosynthesis